VANFLPTINFGGLATGLDTNSLITQLMSLERRPQVLAQQSQKLEETRLGYLKEIDTKLSSLALKAASLRDVATWAKVQKATSSAEDVLTATVTGSNAPGAYTVQVTALARAQQIKQAAGGATSAGSNGDLKIQVGSGAQVTVTLTAGDTLDTVATKINGTSGIGVNASVVSGVLYLSSKTTGAANTIDVQGSLANAFKLRSNQAVTTVTAQDASVSVNGGSAVTSASNDITNAIVGVTISAKSTGTSTLTLSDFQVDADAISTKVQAFVDEYNGLLDYLRPKLAEKRVPNATTDLDRKKGALFGDSRLSNLLAQLRSAVGGTVSGQASDLASLSAVGISTGATTSSGALDPDAIAGKLDFDSAKLKEKLASRPDEVKALFTTDATGAAQGIARRVESYLTPWNQTGGIIDSRIESENSIINALKSRITAMDYRLSQRERSLRQQFAALETAVSNSQQQGSWLAGQIAQLG
jgi:flagellar hook-associated protein 2